MTVVGLPTLGLPSIKGSGSGTASDVGVMPKTYGTDCWAGYESAVSKRQIGGGGVIKLFQFSHRWPCYKSFMV